MKNFIKCSHLNPIIFKCAARPSHSGFKCYKIDAYNSKTKANFPMSSVVSELASKQTNERSGARKRSEQCRASE